MPTQKFITIDTTGKKKLIGAIDSSTGATDGGKIVSLDSTGKLDVSMIPTSVGKVGCILTLSEAVSQGDWVNVFTDGVVYKARLADVNDSAKVCHGYATANGIAGDSILIMFEGLNDFLDTTGFVNGTRYFLGNLGKSVATPDMTTASKFIQPLGYCINTDSSTLAVRFEQDEVVYLE